MFDNVRAKWATVLRRPSRLPGLFSGYHAPVGLVHAVLRAVGIKLEDLTAETAALGVSMAVGMTAHQQHTAEGVDYGWGRWQELAQLARNAHCVLSLAAKPAVRLRCL